MLISSGEDRGGLTARNEMNVVAAELGGDAELLPHRPVLAFAVQSDRRRMVYDLYVHPYE